mmetsp:Transcript_28911/g.73330  ORF Transcript_28911/g.73330 Transcript_28911/m.73330 type:complete len:229 (-) Transcript_28911:1120-1806(-)
MVAAAVSGGMCTLSMDPLDRSCRRSSLSRLPSQFTSKLWKAACSDKAKSSCDVGSMAATNSDHSISPSLSKSAASATRSAASCGTPSFTKKAASSPRLAWPSCSGSPIIAKRCARAPRREAGSCVAARAIVARHSSWFSRSCSSDCTCSRVRRIWPLAEAASCASQGFRSASRALGRSRSPKLRRTPMSWRAFGLALAISCIGGPLCCASSSAARPCGSFDLGRGANG